MEECTDSYTVIAVDLDGTLTLTDTLHESVVALVRDNPIYLFALPFWLAQGKAILKAKVADRVGLDVTTLPYNQPLIDWLKKERGAGERMVKSKICCKFSLAMTVFQPVRATIF